MSLVRALLPGRSFLARKRTPIGSAVDELGLWAFQRRVRSSAKKGKATAWPACPGCSWELFVCAEPGSRGTNSAENPSAGASAAIIGRAEEMDEMRRDETR